VLEVLAHSSIEGAAFYVCSLEMKREYVIVDKRARRLGPMSRLKKLLGKSSSSGQWSQPFEGESTFPVLAIFAILLKWKSPKEGGLARKAL